MGTTEYRQLDPRIGRWLTIDPLASKYPSMSPYTSMNNNPITTNDIYGLEGNDYIKKAGSKTWEYDSRVKTEGDAIELYGEGTRYAAPGYEFDGAIHGVATGDRIKLGEGGTWSSSGGEKGTLKDNAYGYVDPGYSEQQLEYEQRHKKLVANSKALDNLLIDATSLMLSPITTSYKTLNAVISGGSNLANQLAANGGNWNEVDVLSVGVSAGASFITGKPIISIVSSTTIDALVDVKIKNTGVKVESIFKGEKSKSMARTLNDAIWIGLGNLGNHGASKQGVPGIISSPITGFPTTVINYNLDSYLK